MTTLYMTRKEIIDDLSKAFREQNDLESMSDSDLAAAWISHGIHAGTWDWDDVCVDRLYYNAEMGKVDMLSMFRDWQGEDLSREDFDAWVSEHLTNIEYFADEYSLDKLNDEFCTQEGEYLVIELDSEDTPEYPHIPQAVWNDLEAYDDGIFSEITSGQAVNLPTALVQLKLLRGRAVPEIGYPGHGFTGYDGMIMRVE